VFWKLGADAPENVLTAFCAAPAAKEASLSHVLFQHPSVGKVGSIRLHHATQGCDDYTKPSFCNNDIEHLSGPGKSAVKIRLDHLLLQRGFANSRSKAQDLIRRGVVRVGGETVLKTGLLVPPDEPVQVIETEQYVARSAHKLKPALGAFGFSPEGRVCLDAGASTGGFTQVLLERGAACVYAVDVGTGQLHSSLRLNPKVVSLESTDARLLRPETFASAPQGIVCDLSFISLLKVLPSILPLAAPDAWLIALIKPQFEVGRAAVGKGGIVKDEAAKTQAIARVVAYIEEAGWTVRGTLPSPIAGQDGNEETLVGAIRNV
jgi:23S rRNA (cytidine1920-2'-O)/16S rRNA (cytidine1409-2'-O)-methyltransferase